MRDLDIIQADAHPKRAFSNHSEYQWWAERNCYRCIWDRRFTNDGGCPLVYVAWLGRTPKEWTLPEGSFMDYTCSEFWEDRGDDGPQPPVVPDLDPAQDALDGLFELSLSEFPSLTAVDGGQS